ncbi:MAG: D-sedoheptulose 7-phosphate isomerase [Candidatus Omnitrophota bacterium]
MKKIIEKDLLESISLTQDTIKNKLGIIQDIAESFISCLKKGNKIILFGNGGSAADAQHIAAELVGRFEKNRGPLAAISLNTNTSCLTAIANDFGYDNVFSKQIEALGKPGDIALGISTSGNSKNVLEAIKKAKHLGLITIGFSGKKSDDLSKICDLSFVAESSRTCRIQEMHIKVGHIICNLVELAIS